MSASARKAKGGFPPAAALRRSRGLGSDPGLLGLRGTPARPRRTSPREGGEGRALRPGRASGDAGPFRLPGEVTVGEGPPSFRVARGAPLRVRAPLRGPGKRVGDGNRSGARTGPCDHPGWTASGHAAPVPHAVEGATAMPPSLTGERSTPRGERRRLSCRGWRSRASTAGCTGG